MTQTLDVLGERFAPPAQPTVAAAPARAATKSGTFAVTFGIAFALLYTAFERLNWPLFTYHPVSGIVDFGRQAAGVGPPMFWYGWIVLAAASALVIALAATLVPARALCRLTLFACALAALWPSTLTLLQVYIVDYATFDADFLNSPFVAAVPALAGAALLTFVAPARHAERVRASLLLIAPIGGLIVLGYSLQQYFVR